MSQRMRNLVSLEGRLELRRVVVGQGFGLPLVVVLGEKLHTIAATFGGNFDRSKVAAGNRLVGAEDGHRRFFQVALNRRGTLPYNLLNWDPVRKEMAMVAA